MLKKCALTEEGTSRFHCSYLLCKLAAVIVAVMTTVIAFKDGHKISLNRNLYRSVSPEQLLECFIFMNFIHL